jgi:hypothetical protein
MNTRLLRVSMLALVLAAGHATALADDGKGAGGQPPATPDALKGPKVPDRHVPGVDNGLGTMEGGGGDKKGAAREMPIPHREFMRMLNESVGANAPESVRLSAEQRTQVEKISTEFGEKQRTYAQTNKGEIDKLVEKYGPEVRQLSQRLMAARGGMPGGAGGAGDAKRPGKEGGKPGIPGEKGEKGERDGKPMGERDGMKDGTPMEGGGGGLSDEARAEVIGKLKELQAGAPKPEDARQAIWGVLNADQKAAVEKRVDAFKAEREKQQDERYKEREKKKLEERGAKKDAGAPGKGGRPGAGEAVQPLDPARRAELLKQFPDDLRERVGKMPEQTQDRLLTRYAGMDEKQREEAYIQLRERLKHGGGEGAGRPGKK